MTKEDIGLAVIESANSCAEHKSDLSSDQIEETLMHAIGALVI